MLPDSTLSTIISFGRFCNKTFLVNSIHFFYSHSQRRKKSSDLYGRIWNIVSLSGRGARLVTCRVELVGVSSPVCIQSTLEHV